jgi:hypothetical protein
MLLVLGLVGLALGAGVLLSYSEEPDAAKQTAPANN